jgi:hypothetical protein
LLFSIEDLMRNKFAAVFLGAALGGALFIQPSACPAKVQITVDLSLQTMSVDSSSGSYSWPISSARDGYVTPRGNYRVQSLQPMHFSKKYHNSPMPHSIFFNGGYAIHGTYDLGNLGRPASHGCVRISPANAATLFALVQEEGASIEIVGTTPEGRVRPADNDPATSAPASRRRDAKTAPEKSEFSLSRIFGFSR